MLYLEVVHNNIAINKMMAIMKSFKLKLKTLTFSNWHPASYSDNEAHYLPWDIAEIFSANVLHSDVRKWNTEKVPIRYRETSDFLPNQETAMSNMNNYIRFHVRADANRLKPGDIRRIRMHSSPDFHAAFRGFLLWFPGLLAAQWKPF